ncbi:MAG: DnaD domain protein [Bacillota bacterium]|nr:DnaD domain protein [Bacillota bacterium]
MQQPYLSLEVLRWGFAHLPGAILFYARELELDMEDIGILSTLFYAFENDKPLFETGVQAGRVLQCCSTLTTNKLSKKLLRLVTKGIIELSDSETKSFTDKTIYIDPLMEKLEQLIMRDHPRFLTKRYITEADQEETNQQLEEYRDQISKLEALLQEKENDKPIVSSVNLSVNNTNYKRVADFIAKKTGNLLSVKMENELSKWLQDMGFKTDFLLCMLEMTFERNIVNPRDITKIARDLKEYSINTVEGLELYFTTYVDSEKSRVVRTNQFDPDIMDFGSFTGLDMNAEARKKVYYKWRYDWAFTHQMIMKAGEVMCQRTKNGGLEYIDSVLNNWMAKEIRSVKEAEKEIAEFKTKNKTSKSKSVPVTPSGKIKTSEYEIYVPPEVLDELKSNV